MATVKPRPSAWDWRCPDCEGAEAVDAGDEMRGCGTANCIPFSHPYRLTDGARWGAEWAAVAWMAAAEFEGWLCLYSEGQHGDRESWREGIADHLNGRAGILVDWGME